MVWPSSWPIGQSKYASCFPNQAGRLAGMTYPSPLHDCCPHDYMISAGLLERRACETSFVAAASQQQPASCSQPAKQASQPSQPASQSANVASGHRGLRPPGGDVSKLFYRDIQSGLIRWYVGIRRHPLASGGTSC